MRRALTAADLSDRKRGGYREWMVIDPQSELVCLTVYKRGAEEVVRRLAA
ncbi:MAG TPA: hypothetical protein VFJ82_11995 [Longimicrobium sp.]|nr:hypothetical protein [Longimicrobium sp.]